METPIMINPSQIKWACTKTGIVCFLIGIVFDIIIGDNRIMNRPVQVIERKETVFEVQSIYEATILEEGKWDFIPKDTPIKKEKP